MGVELNVIKHSLYEMSLRRASHRYTLTANTVHVLLFIEEVQRLANVIWVERKTLKRNGCITDRNLLRLTDALVQAGFIDKRGGSLPSPNDPSKTLRYNRAQYTLTGKALPVIQFVKDTYAELLEKPLEQRYRGGVIKGSKRAGGRGKVIYKPELPTI